MVKENLVYTHNRILFKLKKKEGSFAICDNMMNLQDIVVSETRQP